MQKEFEDVIIIGAGSTGIGLALELRLRGSSPVIVEEALQVGASWRARHDQLCLNTHRRYSGLASEPLPSTFNDFPTKEQFIGFLEKCAAELGDSICFGEKVSGISKNGENWLVNTNARVIEAKHVVVATGTDRLPVVPAWDGIDSYTGEMLHSADFGDASRFAGKRVLLVGIGNSAVDVGNHLSSSGVGKSWVSIRSGSHVIPQYMFGIAAYRILMMMRWIPISLQDALVRMSSRLLLGDLRRIGLPSAPKGPVSRSVEDGVVVAVDDGFISAIKSGQFEVCGEIEHFSTSSVHLADDKELSPDVIIFATGYEPGLSSLLGGLDMLDRNGKPKHSVDQDSTEHPNLWSIGFTTTIYGNLYTRIDETVRLADAIMARRIRDQVQATAISP